MLICWDLAFPEAFRELIAQGAKIMWVFLFSLLLLYTFPLPCRRRNCATLLMIKLCCSIIPTFWKLDDCNEAGLRQNPAAEALFLDSMLTARAFENTCGRICFFVLIFMVLSSFSDFARICLLTLSTTFLLRRVLIYDVLMFYP